MRLTVIVAALFAVSADAAALQARQGGGPDGTSLAPALGALVSN
jgi:hypothetical protein